MEIRGKVVEINLDAQIAKNGGGTYPGATISYRDANGKLQEKGFHTNSLKYNAALKNGLENLQTSDNFVAQAEKNDAGFWDWKSIAKDSGGNTTTTTASNTKQVVSSNVVSSTYATKEERAQTQVYIVRQSSLTNALKLLEIQGKKSVDKFAVISLAQQFEAWVLGKPIENSVIENNDPFKDMEDDIPL